MKTSNQFIVFLKSVGTCLIELIALITQLAVEIATEFSIRVLKRYFNIETPLYKRYWEKRSEWIQRTIDNAHPEFKNQL